MQTTQTVGGLPGPSWDAALSQTTPLAPAAGPAGTAPGGTATTGRGQLLADVGSEVQATNQLAELAGGLPALPASAPLSFPSTAGSMAPSLQQMGPTDAAGAQLGGGTVGSGDGDDS